MLIRLTIANNALQINEFLVVTPVAGNSFLKYSGPLGFGGKSGPMFFPTKMQLTFPASLFFRLELGKESGTRRSKFSLS